MNTSRTRNGLNFVFAVCVLIFIFIAFGYKMIQESWIDSDDVSNFKTLFISLILEAFPFILLGVLVSAILQTFVSEQTIRRFTPRNPILAVSFASTLGIFFPICECGMIPVVRRLIRKGMPIYIGIVFILAGPILNPVVFASTYMAFRSRPEIAYSRMGLAFVVACTIGLLLYKFLRNNPMKASEIHSASHSHGIMNHQHTSDSPAHPHEHHAEQSIKINASSKFTSMLNHATEEFFEMGKYILIGAILTSLIQTFVVRESLLEIGQGAIGSHVFMMGFAYILSICSTSDAFIAASFGTTFTAGSLLTFLTFGPMLDLKSTIMLLTVFKGKFVLKLSLLIAITVLLGSLLFELLFLK